MTRGDTRLRGCHPLRTSAPLSDQLRLPAPHPSGLTFLKHFNFLNAAFPCFLYAFPEKAVAVPL